MAAVPPSRAIADPPAAGRSSCRQRLWQKHTPDSAVVAFEDVAMSENGAAATIEAERVAPGQHQPRTGDERESTADFADNGIPVHLLVGWYAVTEPD
jgi:hypothetical protein